LERIQNVLPPHTQVLLLAAGFRRRCFSADSGHCAVKTLETAIISTRFLINIMERLMKVMDQTVCVVVPYSIHIATNKDSNVPIIVGSTCAAKHKLVTKEQLSEI